MQQSTKFHSKLSAQVASKKKNILNVRPAVHALILEMLLPRIHMLRQIVWTRIVPETRMDEADGDVDWWPDYAVYSHTHAITDMKGLLCFAQDSMKGMPDEMTAIAVRFHRMYDEVKHQMRRLTRSRYRLVLSLIKDIVEFVRSCHRHCDVLLEERRKLYERANATRETGDRIRLKIFDEHTFVQLHSKMSNLKSFAQEFCDLFEPGDIELLPPASAASSGSSKRTKAVL
ncbi:uncharacterized protein LOC115633092 [Scaptodrosophila lebanonensis]|uniref:Uncharacterized protein LOC115633092 n=1 Tax=Drosophila lebanonensis TaxID=7225 RepID=A0A6J2UCX7_DROLE|nr:uncharacterized protein LOC115633092 [Scaptodrosophila lebanonensis]